MLDHLGYALIQAELRNRRNDFDWDPFADDRPHQPRNRPWLAVRKRRA